MIPKTARTIVIPKNETNTSLLKKGLPFCFRKFSNGASLKASHSYSVIVYFVWSKIVMNLNV